MLAATAALRAGISKDALIASSTPTHSAAGQAAGYEFQRQLALVLFCEAYGQDPSVRVRLEAVEDIDVMSDEASIDSRIQVKHHLKDFTLTDRALELWKTLTVWMDLLKTLPGGRLPQLHLMTTSAADPDGAAALLGPTGRDVEEAIRRLLVVAGEEGAEATRSARSRFLGLDDGERHQLLSATTVLDNAQRVTDLDGRLRKALGLVVPSERPVEFLQQLKGWWVGRSSELLSGSRSHIAGGDLYAFCDGLRDAFRRGNLQITEELTTEPTEAEKEPLLRRPFIRQLQMVMATSEALDLAVRHYYRAYAQRGRWSRELEDLDEDIEGYERHLRDEWEIAFVAMCARAPTTDPERAALGLDLAMTLGDRTSAQPRGIGNPVLCRGTLHGLADQLTVGWHPDFRDRLQELLGE